MSARPALTDDCFSRFDAAFASLETELGPPPSEEPGFPVPGAEADLAPASPTMTPDEDSQVTLDEYEDAFNKLDSCMARATLLPAASASLWESIQAATLDVSSVAPSRPATAAAAAAPVSLPPAHVPTPGPVWSAPVSVTRNQEPAVSVARILEQGLWQAGGSETTSLDRLVGTLENLALIQETMKTTRGVTEEDLGVDTFRQVFTDARQVCREFNLETGRVRADFALAALESGHVDRLGSEVTELVRHMRHDVTSCTVSPIANDRLWAFKLTLGAQAASAFPSAETELVEGGRCFGMGRYTACVFHMMRAAEYGLCALAHAADARRAVDSTDADWTDVIAQLEVKVGAIERWRGEPDKLTALEFFHDALRDVRSLHDVARKLANTKSSFDETQALTIFQTARDFIVRLSARVSESQKRTLLKADFSAAGEAAVPIPAMVRPLTRTRRTTVGFERDLYDVAADTKRK